MATLVGVIDLYSKIEYEKQRLIAEKQLAEAKKIGLKRLQSGKWKWEERMISGCRTFLLKKQC